MCQAEELRRDQNHTYMQGLRAHRSLLPSGNNTAQEARTEEIKYPRPSTHQIHTRV